MQKKYLNVLGWLLLFFLVIDFTGKIEAQSLSTYKQIKIGKQIWMTENLNVDQFQNGDRIPQAITEEQWNAANANEKPAWCYYDDKPSNGASYGKLYNWYAINDRRGLAPDGWHVPSVEEYEQLIKSLGKEAGKKMKSITGWNSGGSLGNNASGFSALPGGARAVNDYSMFMGQMGFWWTSTMDGDKELKYAKLIRLDYEYDKVFIMVESRNYGISVRCVRD